MKPTIPSYKILLFFVIVGAAMYFALSSTGTPDSFEVNGFTFEEVVCPDAQTTCYDTVVYTNIGGRQITFYSDPRDLSDIFVDPGAVEAVLNLTRSRNTSVTIAFDEGVPGDVGVSATLIARVTGERVYNISTRGAVYGQDITCAQSTPEHRVVYLTQQQQEGAYLDGECVIIAANDVSRLRDVVDAYTMHLLLIL